MNSRLSAVFVALAAAGLFGAATPLAKALLGSMSAFMVAGLFYLGSGVGLGIGILARRLGGLLGTQRPAIESRKPNCRG